MSKSEIQPLRTLILRTSYIVFLLINSHRVPDSISLLVAADVVCFDEVEEDDVKGADAEEDSIASEVYFYQHTGQIKFWIDDKRVR